MSQSPREVVTRTIRFENPDRISQHTWLLPWAQKKYPQETARIAERYPDDIVWAPFTGRPSSRATGNPYSVGISVDEWGCIFENVHEGIIGEVKNPIMKDITDLDNCRPPYETLPENLDTGRDEINRFCENCDKFVIAGCPRPWEQMQFLRGTVEAMMDIISAPEDAEKLLKKMHDYYMTVLEYAVSTSIDGIMFMDDWGSQQSLLINPSMWRELFKPLYSDYCQLAKAHGKSVFMHSDGCIIDILPDLIEIGVDAINSQLFVMDFNRLEAFKGQITFWGEIDRQHILTNADPQKARDAVRKVAKHLFDLRGGIISQLEFGPGAYPQSCMAVHDEWQKVFSEACSGKS